MKKNTKFHFKTFQTLFSKYYPNYNIPDKKFLEWFIGFFEGDGSFVSSKRLNNKYYFHFVITQSNKDKQILHFIQNKIGFGKVISQNQNTSRYIVQDNLNIFLLINLFNGNLVLPKTFSQYSKTVNYFNNNNSSNFIIKNQLILPQFNDYWICGFTDAEGHFGCSILKNPKIFRYRFIITQKGKENISVLIQIKKILGGKVESHTVKNVYQLVVNGITNIIHVMNYFDEHKLLTKKKKSYYLWKNIGKDFQNKKHLISKYNKELKMKSQFINK